MTVKKSFHIEAPVKTVFEFFRSGKWADVAMMDVHDMKVTREGVGTHYTWDVKVGPVTLHGLSVWTDVVPDRHITERTTDPFPATWEHHFEPEGSGTRYTLELKPRSFLRLPPLGTLAGVVMARMGEGFLARVSASLEKPAATAVRTQRRTARPTTPPKPKAVGRPTAAKRKVAGPSASRSRKAAATR